MQLSPGALIMLENITFVEIDPEKTLEEQAKNLRHLDEIPTRVGVIDADGQFYVYRDLFPGARLQDI